MKVPKGIHVVTDALVKTLSVFSPTFLEKQRNIDYKYTWIEKYPPPTRSNLSTFYP